MSIERKNAHIKYAGKCAVEYNFFKDINILYNSIPELDFCDLDIKAGFLGSNFDAPILINAMTGGSNEGKDINEALAKAAALFNIPMAVGSQSIGIKDKSTRESFTIVRKINKKGFMLANVSAGASVDAAREAVDMIEANGLQLHLNVLQELIMSEGDRKFKGILENINNISNSVSVPVMVKEVGFGMTGETAVRLRDKGIKAIDIGGFGGTNFASIEIQRRTDEFGRDLQSIGIPTTVSLADICNKKTGLEVICGGGIRSGLDIAKSLIMGADAVSIAYPLLNAYKQTGLNGVLKEIEKFIYELKVSMISTGAGSIESLSKKKVVITGRTLQWINQLL